MTTSIAASRKTVWGFSPQSIPGCQLWLDAADTGSLTITGGTTVTDWRDKSGKVNNASVTGGNGTPTLIADGSNQMIRFAALTRMKLNTVLTAPPAIFAVVKSDVASVNLTVVVGYPAGGSLFAGYYFQPTTSSIKSRYVVAKPSDTTIYTENNFPGTNTLFLMAGLHDSSNATDGLQLKLNGTVGTSVGGTSSQLAVSGTFIGNVDFYGGWASVTANADICEIIAFSSVLTTAQQQQVEGYLAAKWGLGMNLHVTHPYSSVIPILPTQIPGCLLWLDAADSSALTISPFSWTDKSGQGNTPTATGTLYGGTPVLPSSTGTINGIRAVRFSSGLNNEILTTMNYNSSPITSYSVSIFMVVQLTSAAQGRLFGGGAFQCYTLAPYNPPSKLGLYNGGTTAEIVSVANVNPSIPFIFNFTAISGLITGFLNGIPFASTSTIASSSFSNCQWGGLGGNTPIDGNIGEILAFNSGLSVIQRQQVEAYLGQKWGIGVTNTTVSPGMYLVPTNRPFYPTDITGCQLWLDSADFSSLVVASNSNITNWKDKSGNGYDAVPCVSGVTADSNMNPPLYTKTPYIGATFDSTRSMASPIPAGTFSTAFSAFVVYNFTGSTQADVNYTLLNRTSGNTFNFVPFSVTQLNGEMWRVIGNSAGYTYSRIFGTPFSITTQSIYYMNINSNANTTWNESVNGTLTSYSTSANSGGSGAAYGDTGTFLSIGGRYDRAVRYSGIISEVICYNSTLTTAQRQQVEQYLGQKWGLLTSLPTGHPGKLLPAFSTNFTPKSLTGMALWLDGADRTSMVLSGTTVTQWNDKSGNTNSAVAVSTPTLSATGAGVTLNAGNCFRVTSLTVPTTTHCLIAVHSPTTVNGSSTGNTSLFRFQQAGGYIVFPYMFSSAPRGYISSYATGGTSITFNTSPLLENSVANTPNLIVANTAATSQIVYKNGTQQNSATASITSGTSDFLVIGANKVGDAAANELYTGTISEILVFNTTLLDSQRQQVEGYLAWKWGLQNSLPSTHAYAKFSP